MKNTLEGSKWFPYIAWTVVIVFALFTYNLLTGIKESIAYLNEKTDENTQAINEYIAIKKEREPTTATSVRKLP